MKLVEEVSDEVTVLEVHGRLDSTTAKEFGDRLTALFRGSGGAIVVDLGNIVYISSAGFRALLIGNQVAKEKQGRLALCGVSGEVRRLFEIGQFTELFMI